ncbi:PREDICTED: uncharacterized protein LOC106808860 [Priapulus caudatus]|uniref:Uncharacterized protein LOC106808860 n=1 Tax=Priapulus caudatus TaxID=37621 RepID=A0ABM1E4W5_PRICU|nr:PREDICTED: uncharacterized protein LOC106808860 [Priapulus caudatus]
MKAPRANALGEEAIKGARQAAENLTEERRQAGGGAQVSGGLSSATATGSSGEQRRQQRGWPLGLRPAGASVALHSWLLPRRGGQKKLNAVGAGRRQSGGAGWCCWLLLLVVLVAEQLVRRGFPGAGSPWCALELGGGGGQRVTVTRTSDIWRWVCWWVLVALCWLVRCWCGLPGSFRTAGGAGGFRAAGGSGGFGRGGSSFSSGSSFRSGGGAGSGGFRSSGIKSGGSFVSLPTFGGDNTVDINNFANIDASAFGFDNFGNLYINVEAFDFNGWRNTAHSAAPREALNAAQTEQIVIGRRFRNGYARQTETSGASREGSGSGTSGIELSATRTASQDATQQFTQTASGDGSTEQGAGYGFEKNNNGAIRFVPVAVDSLPVHSGPRNQLPASARRV